MSENVVPIRSSLISARPKGEPSAELIELMERLLGDARSGHLQAIAYTGVTDERSIDTNWCGHSDIHDVAAGISILGHRFHSAANWDGD